MTGANDPIDDALSPLRDRSWPGDAHMNRLEERLMGEYRPAQSASFVRRHRTLVIALCLFVLAGGAFAGAMLARYMLYDIEITRDGEVIAQPRVLVEEGQEAQVFIGNDREQYIVEILPDGTVVYDVPEGVEVDYSVQEIEEETDEEEGDGGGGE